MKREIKQYAHELGFDLCGIAAAGPAQTHSRYTDWLARGYHAQMGYLARPDAIARRADPRALLPGAQSIVVAAMNYYRPEGFYKPFGSRVARYAWGPDYHQVMTGKLELLARRIESENNNPVSFKNQGLVARPFLINLSFDPFQQKYLKHQTAFS